MNFSFILFIYYLCNTYVDSKPAQIDISTRNPENGDSFEGDIKGVTVDYSKGVAQLITGAIKPWPNGVIPYEIISNNYTKDDIALIQAGMRLVEDSTRVGGKDCVKFIPFTNQPYRIQIYDGDDCSSYIGKPSSEAQKLSLHKSKHIYDGNCLKSGIIAHELIHALGFFHEQSRPDRDYYINIFWDNIDPNYTRNFNKYDSGVDILGTPYDYNSLMHYGPTDFSKNGKPTIQPKLSFMTIGQRENLSKIDVEEIRIYYDCI